MEKIKVAVVGFGNIAKECAVAVQQSPDMTLSGIVLRNPDKIPAARKEVGESVPVVNDVADLGHVDVALLGISSRAIPEVAPRYLAQGINTIDSFDIHGEPLMALRDQLDRAGKAHGSVAVISAGWDPGSDSVVRAILEAIAPKGITYTNFGPGMSMGHTVGVKAIEGVRDALSLTIPKGTGLHKRIVYVEVEDGYDFDAIACAVKEDPYFCHDETYVMETADVQSLIDVGHGVHMERKGISGATHNQRMEFIMSVTNPPATAQVMVSAARASVLQKPGCYTMLEIPPIDYLAGDRKSLIKRLV